MGRNPDTTRRGFLKGTAIPGLAEFERLQTISARLTAERKSGA